MFTKTRKSIEIARAAIISHKLRAVLTILGITVGISAVIVVLSAGKAIEFFITSQVTQFGTDWVQVEVKIPATGHTSVENAGGMAQGITITTMKEKDAVEIQKLSNIKDVYSASTGQEVVSFEDKNKISMIFGVTEGFQRVDTGTISEGRFFTDAEDKGLARVIVLGSKIKDSLFGDQQAIGQFVKIKKYNFKVVGVMAERGSAGVFSMDDMIIMPLRSMQKLILGIDYVTFIMATMKDKSLGPETVDDIDYLMRDLHDITDPNMDDFAATTSDQALEMLAVITGAIKILLFALACISLVVGGVGIMNVMYVSVAERTFEIGLRKALGAKSADILNQFLVEAVIITFMGGILGIILGVFITWLISYVATNFLNFDWQFYFSLTYLLLASGISIFVGLVSGIYPARSAAALDPMVALRKE
ncbi:MAG: ABC transporter permease [Candidatus Parcubacteria bacterium]|nr:ABC transporter permease [Candidatus Parcubacteria bacterium]